MSNVSCFCLLAQQCPFVTVNQNVSVTGDPEEATYGNVLRFSCKSKTDVLEGPNEIYCNEDGEWSGRAPICISKPCRNKRMMDRKAGQGSRTFLENIWQSLGRSLGRTKAHLPSCSNDEMGFKPQSYRIIFNQSEPAYYS